MHSRDIMSDALWEYSNTGKLSVKIRTGLKAEGIDPENLMAKFKAANEDKYDG